MPQSDNLLVALSRWASGQQENFLSDAFVHLLNLLAQQVPDAFTLIVEQMTGGSLTPAPDTAADFTVTSQVSTSEGTPDVEIVGPRCYALIEVKDESPVDEEQVRRYIRLVDQNVADAKCLVLLTRHQAPPLDAHRLLKMARWTQVTESLLKARDTCNFDQISLFTLHQFLGFLEAKGMSVNRAGWEMVSGIQQFQHFKVLLKQAIESAGAEKVNSAAGAGHNGWGVPHPASGKIAYYLFIQFEKPEILVFQCHSNDVLDIYKHEWGAGPQTRGWIERYLDLGSEEEYFFSRGLDSQREALERFVVSCLAQTTHQPSNPISQQPDKP